MKSLSQIRQAYEENYRSIEGVIAEMGGDDCIKEHRSKQSQLYRRLKMLQSREHQLDEIENRLITRQKFLH